MNEVLRALKESIEHWKDLKKTLKQALVRECALCDLFHADDCKGCPICLKTGAILCRTTPYSRYYDNETPENAQKEIDFLTEIYIEELEKYRGEKGKLYECVCCERRVEGHKVVTSPIMDGDFYCIPCWHNQKNIEKTPVKKEEWVDITKQLSVKLEPIANTYYFTIFDGNTQIAFTSGRKENSLHLHDTERYKLKIGHAGNFNIFKKE